MPSLTALVFLISLAVPSLHRPLCEAGMHDTALVYLDWVASRPFIPDELQTGRDLAMAVTHLAALSHGDRATPHEILAREAIERALAADPQSAEATLLAARLRFHAARQRVALAAANESSVPIVAARTLFGESEQLATTAAALANATAKAARQRAVSEAELAPLFATILQAKLLALEAAHRAAMTFPDAPTSPSSPSERAARLATAVEAAKAMARRYAAYQGGLEAKCLAVEMLRDSGNAPAARETLAEIEPLAWSDFPLIRTRGLRLTLELNRQDAAWDDSRARRAAWIDKTSPSDRATPEAAACWEVIAETLLDEAAALEATDTTGATAEARLHSESRTALESIPTSLRSRRVDSLLASLNQGQTPSADGTTVAPLLPQTLDEAQRQIDERLTALRRLESGEHDAAALRVAIDETLRAIEVAMTLADATVSAEAMGRWRRQAARLHAAAGDPLAAAIVAESTLPVWGDEVIAGREVPPLLLLAIQCYSAFRERERDASDNTLFRAVTPRLATLAAAARTHFPGTSPAREAERVSLMLAMDNDRPDDALAALDRIDDDIARGRAARDGAISAWNRFVASLTTTATASGSTASGVASEQWFTLTERFLERVAATPDDASLLEVVRQIEEVRAERAAGAVVPTDEVERLAKAGEFAKALATLRERLREHPNNLPLQQRAASLAAAWGQRDATHYRLALDGDEMLWGWRGITVRTASDPQLREPYFAACYEKWRCALAWAAKLNGDEQERLRHETRRDWERFQILHPTAGGPLWKRRYESLFKTQ